MLLGMKTLFINKYIIIATIELAENLIYPVYSCLRIFVI